MDRSAEFKGILAASLGSYESEERRKLLHTSNPDTGETDSLLATARFGKQFLGDCFQLNDTLNHLARDISQLIAKPDVHHFSLSLSPQSQSPTGAIEEALDICSASLSMLQRRLTEHRIDTSAEQRTGLLTSLLSWRVPQRPVASEQLLLEHCELVCRFLKAKTGKLAERVETYKQRSRSSQLASIGGSCTVRQRLISDSRSSNTGKNSSDPVSLDANGSFATGSRFTFSSKLPTDGRSIVNNKLAKDDGSPSTHPANTEPNRLQLQLQLENSELASDLLNTLAATESAVLHLARLQAALQSHLDTQHDLACRLFEESTAVEGDVDRGNRYLRGSAEGSSAARRILVAMMLMASLILLLLHYLK